MVAICSNGWIGGGGGEGSEGRGAGGKEMREEN